MRLGAVYNQMFISPLVFGNKKVNNNINNIYNDDNNDNTNEIVNTPATFVMTFDHNNETIMGTYNAGDFRILTPSKYAGMIYGEIKGTNTKFLLQTNSTTIYGQDFSNYDVHLNLSTNARGLFVVDKNIDTTQDIRDYVIWAYVNELGYELQNSTSLKTVLLSEYSDYNGDVFSYTNFGNAPNLTTVILSDNKPYSENGNAFKDCQNIKDVRIILNQANTPNAENIKIIKNSFPSPKPTFTLYNPL